MRMRMHFASMGWFYLGILRMHMGLLHRFFWHADTTLFAACDSAGVPGLAGYT
ncbi:hypothetical protein BDV10DRAFT_155384 [Aspergillus recurvatus]